MNEITSAVRGSARRRVGSAAGAAVVLPALLTAAPAQAHHTGCYVENRNPSPHGSYDKYARGSSTFNFYITVEGGGYRRATVYVRPEVHGHGHSCLASVGAASVTMPNNGDYATVAMYYRKSSGTWINAGSWRESYGSLHTPRSKLDWSSPRSFTHGKVVVSYHTRGGVSMPRHITCALASHSTSRHSCSAGSGTG